jgi:hypothetical protein
VPPGPWFTKPISASRSSSRPACRSGNHQDAVQSDRHLTALVRASLPANDQMRHWTSTRPRWFGLQCLLTGGGEVPIRRETVGSEATGPKTSG